MLGTYLDAGADLSIDDEHIFKIISNHLNHN